MAPHLRKKLTHTITILMMSMTSRHAFWVVNVSNKFPADGKNVVFELVLAREISFLNLLCLSHSIAWFLRDFFNWKLSAFTVIQKCLAAASVASLTFEFAREWMVLSWERSGFLQIKFCISFNRSLIIRSKVVVLTNTRKQGKQM